jgi:hypothetical protein
MADTFYSVVLGEHHADKVTKGASTSGEIIELRVHDGDGTTKLQLLNALEAIKEYITRADKPA